MKLVRIRTIGTVELHDTFHRERKKEESQQTVGALGFRASSDFIAASRGWNEEELSLDNANDRNLRARGYMQNHFAFPWGRRCARNDATTRDSSAREIPLAGKKHAARVLFMSRYLFRAWIGLVIVTVGSSSVSKRNSRFEHVSGWTWVNQGVVSVAR